MTHLPIPRWSSRVPESSLSFRIAPIADDWRYQLVTGGSEFAKEVRTAIAARAFDSWDPPSTLYQYGTESSVVGHLALGASPVGHPSRMSTTKKLYVTIDLIEVAKEFQGEWDPHGRRNLDGEPTETYAGVMLRHAELALAPDVASRLRLRRRKRPLGLYAIVRVGNERALRLFRGLGYAEDADGVFEDGFTKQPSLLLRKALPGVEA